MRRTGKVVTHCISRQASTWTSLPSLLSKSEVVSSCRSTKFRKLRKYPDFASLVTHVSALPCGDMLDRSCGCKELKSQNIAAYVLYVARDLLPVWSTTPTCERAATESLPSMSLTDIFAMCPPRRVRLICCVNISASVLFSSDLHERDSFLWYFLLEPVQYPSNHTYLPWRIRHDGASSFHSCNR